MADNTSDLMEEEIRKLMGFSNFGKRDKRFLDLKKVIEKTKLSEDVRAFPNKENNIEESVGKHVNIDLQDLDKHPENLIPATNRVVFSNGRRTVSTISINSSGGRIVTGSYDYEVRFLDFHAMGTRFEAFRTITPFEVAPIRNVEFSPGSDLVIICGTCNELKIVDKDGVSVVDCVSGDGYILDALQTKGHTSSVYFATWNPKDLQEFMSCSQDGTVRTWDLEACKFNCKRTIKFRTPNGKFSAITAATYTKNGTEILTSSLSGNLQAFDFRRTLNVPIYSLNGIHDKDMGSTNITFDHTGNYLASRGRDDTLKIFDIRSLKKECFLTKNLPNNCDSTRCIFSPDSRMIITGTSMTREDKTGRLCFFNAKTQELVSEIKFENKSVVSLVWHSKLNQIFVGCSDGEVHALFDPDRSHGGAIKAASFIKLKKTYAGENNFKERVLLPQGQTMAAEDDSFYKLRAKSRNDPIKSKKPDPPIFGPGMGGRLSSTLTASAYLCKKYGMVEKDEGDKDPRGSILQFAKLASEDPFFIAPAYQESQPKSFFQDLSDDEDSEEDTGLLHPDGKALKRKRENKPE